MSEIRIRNEMESDSAKISDIITLAFEHDPMSDKREAEIGDQIVGHIAFSKVTIDEQFIDWYGLAPVSIATTHQNQGIGSILIREGIKRLKEMNAHGCVLLGEPSYYGRFGLKAHQLLVLPDIPAEYFQALSFSDKIPNGIVKYHNAFE